jgi:hypothetical protein
MVVLYIMVLVCYLTPKKCFPHFLYIRVRVRLGLGLVRLGLGLVRVRVS